MALKVQSEPAVDTLGLVDELLDPLDASLDALDGLDAVSLDPLVVLEDELLDPLDEPRLSVL